MAAGLRKRKAVDRLPAARRRLDEAKGIWRVHLKVCSRCHFAGSDYTRLCDDGWAQIKAVTRTGNQVRRLTEAAELDSRQGVLF